MAIKHGALLALFSMLLGACGFHLKSVTPQPTGVVTSNVAWAVEGERSMANVLRKTLHFSGLKAPEAGDILVVRQADFSRSNASINLSGQVIEVRYVLRVTVEVEQKNVDSAPVIIEEGVRYIPFTDGEILAKNIEEETVKNVLQQDVANKIVARLPFVLTQANQQTTSPASHE